VIGGLWSILRRPGSTPADSAMSLPTYSLSVDILNKIRQPVEDGRRIKGSGPNECAVCG